MSPLLFHLRFVLFYDFFFICFFFILFRNLPSHEHDTLIIAGAFVTNQTEAILNTGSTDTNRAKGRNGNGDGNDDDVVVAGINGISSGGILSVEGSTVSEYKRHMLVMCRKIKKYAPWLDQHSPSFITDPSSTHPSDTATSHLALSSEHLPQTQSTSPPTTYWNREQFTILLGHRRALIGDDDLEMNNMADAPFQQQVSYMRWLCSKLLEGTFAYTHHQIKPSSLLVVVSKIHKSYLCLL